MFWEDDGLLGICFRARRTVLGQPAIPSWRCESRLLREFACCPFLQFQQARQSQSPAPQHHQSAAVEGLDELRKVFSTFCRSPATRHKCKRPNSIFAIQQGKTLFFFTASYTTGRNLQLYNQ